MRGQLSDEQIRQWSRTICQTVRALPLFQTSRAIGCYLPIDHEVDASCLWEPVPRDAPAPLYYLPVVAERALFFVPYQPGDPLQTGAHGTRVPVQQAGGLSGPAIGQLDLLILPLVGFDGRGGRLGFGGGYYDRLLAPWNPAMGGQSQVQGLPRPRLLGLAYAFQQVPELPLAAHDQRLDWVVTEQMVHAFDHSSDG